MTLSNKGRQQGGGQVGWILLLVRPPPPQACTRATNGLATCAALSASWKSPPATTPGMVSICPAEKMGLVAGSAPMSTRRIDFGT